MRWGYHDAMLVLLRGGYDGSLSRGSIRCVGIAPPYTRAMRRLVPLVVILVAVTACRSPESEPAPTSTAPATSPSSSTTTTVVDDAALCNGYLVLLRTGDPEPLRAELDDGRLQQALDTMLSSEGEFDAIAQASLELEEAIVSRCADRYSSNLEPAADDTTAVTRFMEHVVAGNDEAADPLAWDHVMAQLTPWSVIEPAYGGDGLGFTVDGDTATVRIDPRTTLTCRADGGVVVSCSYGE